MAATMKKSQTVRLRNEHLSVTLTAARGQLTLALSDPAGRRRWGPVPLLAVEVHDKAVRRTDRIESFRIDELVPVPDGVRVNVALPAQYSAVGLWIRLVDNELVVSLVPDEVYERRPDVYRVFAVDVLPGLLDVGGDGHLLLPVNLGVLCCPQGKPALRDRFLIYMEQERWELLSTLPVCGAADPHGGVVILASAGACDAECRVATDGHDRGHVGFAISLRRHWPDPVAAERRDLRFALTPAGADITRAAAQRVRRHAVEDCGKRPLSERRRECPELDYLLGAYIMKLFYGMEHEGYYRQHSGDKPCQVTYRSYMTFDEALDGLRRLRKAGVRRVLTQSVGWNARGHDGLYPTRFPVNERAGGEAGFRRLIAEGNRLGFNMNVHDNFMMNVPHSPDWDPECVTQDRFGEPLVHGWWAGGVEYASWPAALPQARVEGHLERVKALGIKGMYYCDYMMQPLEVNYHPRHRGGRADYCRGMIRILDAARRCFGAVATEMGTFPATMAADCIVTPGSPWHLNGFRREWPVTALCDRVVPLWFLALGGLVVTEAHPGTRWRGAMECILEGRHPRDEWSAHPGLHPVLDAHRVAALAAIYDICLVRHGGLQLQAITDAQWEGEQRETTFADGSRVQADLKAGRLFVNGKAVPRPRQLDD
ncbi:MAG: hypothetical protein BWZ02_02342 [Lentisphaerae bacterium ADurb.BinA184]|nr:MAG: hypothetical protein BWZ02_02342 [Lentisphaerae bacterium ADurb.BinA184]